MEKSKWVPAVRRREAERIQFQELGQKTEGCKCFLEPERNKAASRSLELAQSMEDCKPPEAEASNWEPDPRKHHSGPSSFQSARVDDSLLPMDLH
jgi:hypothetical protein